MDGRPEENIQVTLLGRPMVKKDGKPVNFPYQKVEGLFYYLCINKNITRSQAIGVLWAGSSQEAARKNLRDAIYNIRKLLGQEILSVEGNTGIIFDPLKKVWLDTEHVTKDNVLRLWQGEFLEFFFVKNCYEYEEWAETQRREIQRKLQRLLSVRIFQFKSDEKGEILEQASRLLIKYKVLDEELYRSLMKKLAEAGRYGEAQNLYRDLKEMLRTEIDAGPEGETKNLFDKIEDMKRQENRVFQEGEDYFFGRKDILYRIYSELCYGDQGTRQSPHSFLLCGETGVGKSMLLHRIRQLLEESGYLMFSWECCQTEKELYLKPWYGIMEKVDEYCRMNQVQVESPTGILLEQKVLENRLFMTRFEILTETVFRYLWRYFKGKEIILFFDDIQWMDDMSLKLLGNLLFRLGNQQLRVIAAVREENQEELSGFKIPLVGRGILKEVMVSPFTWEEALQISRDTGREGRIPEARVEEIYKRTQGNPLFYMEALRLLREGGQDIEFTDKLSYVIEGRLMALKKEELQVLKALSVFSVSVPCEDIEAVLNAEGQMIQKALAGLLDARMIFERFAKGRVSYEFRHKVIQEYVYNSLSKEKQMLYHYRAADYYEKQYNVRSSMELCSLLIYHCQKYGDRYKALDYKVKYLEPFYRITYDYYPILARKVKFRPKINGYQAKEDELGELAREIEREWEKDSSMAPVYMRVEYLLGRYEMYTEAFSQGIIHIYNSLQLALKLGHRDYIFYNYMQLILYGEMTGKTAITLEYLHTCWEFIKDCATPRAEEACMLKRHQAQYLMGEGKTEEALEILRQAVEELEKGGRENPIFIELAMCCHVQGICYMRESKWEEAWSSLEKASKLGEQYLHSGEEGIFYGDAAIALAHMGQFEESKVLIEKARKCFKGISSLWGEADTELSNAVWAGCQHREQEYRNSMKIAKEIAKKLGSAYLWEKIEDTEKAGLL